MHKNKKGEFILMRYPWFFLSIFVAQWTKEDGVSLSEMPCPLSLSSYAAPTASSRCQDLFPVSLRIS